MIDRVQAMRIFVRIVDTSSFTRATATTIVPALASLLGVQLLVRTIRKVTLTAEAAAY